VEPLLSLYCKHSLIFSVNDWNCQELSYLTAPSLCLAALNRQLSARQLQKHNSGSRRHWSSHDWCNWLAPDLLPSKASVNSRSYFHPGQRGSTSQVAQQQAHDWYKHSPSLAWEAVLWLVQTPLPHPLSGCISELFGPLFKAAGRHPPLLSRAISLWLQNLGARGPNPQELELWVSGSSRSH
jgi:hypothetical protein